MSDAPDVKRSGPVRVSVPGNRSIRVGTDGGVISVLSGGVATSLRLVGTPGPQGLPGQDGTDGNLDAGIVIDGGNF